MKNLFWLALPLTLIQTISFSQNTDKITKIAFGSCSNQDKPLPIYDVVASHKPNYFIFLGDNIYADTEDMDVFKKKYDQLASNHSFQNMKKTVPKILATWDDHDYGDNDAGRKFSKKKESKEMFLKFFEEPKSSDRWTHEGIFTSYMYKINGRKLQIILLDNRTFREGLKTNVFKSKNDRFFYTPSYLPHDDHEDFLGAEQWAWLEKELNKDADIRIIGSGTQFCTEYNGYETWANFPHEQQRMFDLIKKTKANGVMFITGDVHYAEISRRNEADIYPIYDVTASGLSSNATYPAPNEYRVEGPILDNHFGMITIDWAPKDPTIKMEIWDVNDNQRLEYTISTSEIDFKRIDRKVKVRN